jgi:hypothetical protein
MSPVAWRYKKKLKLSGTQYEYIEDKSKLPAKSGIEALYLSGPKILTSGEIDAIIKKQFPVDVNIPWEVCRKIAIAVEKAVKNEL